MLLDQGQNLAKMRLAIFFLILFSLSLGVQAQEGWEFKSSAQVGIDAWHVSPKENALHDYSFLPNSNPRWNYQKVSPWYTFSAQLNNGSGGEFVLRARGEQSYGGAVDELSYAQAISPSLGLRAGVLDYRATWCRVYDLDNPWVRETDPFCTDRATNLATASAPALQGYVNLDFQTYRVQGVAGIYRPLAFNYEPREFSNFLVPETAGVTKNKKQGISVNAVNKETSTELRFSWIGSRQSLFDTNQGEDQFGSLKFYPLNYHQKVQTYFAGFSWLVTENLRSRVTHFRSSLSGTCEALSPEAPSCFNVFRKNSTVLELNYQASAKDVLSAAYSTYGSHFVRGWEASTLTASLAWRRDWSRGWFTSLQATKSAVVMPYNNVPNDPHQAGKANAWSLGLRVGYQL